MSKLRDILIGDIMRPKISTNTYLYKEPIIDNSVTGLNATDIQAANPSIVYDYENSRWLIYFFANVDGPETYVAESRDLLSVKYISKAIPRGGPGSFDELSAHKANVVYHNDKFYAFYAGDDVSGRRRIGLAVSDDGISFTKMGVLIEDPEGTGYLDSPSVIKWKDGFYMYAYNGNGYNLIFKTSFNEFPYGWRLVGKLESRLFGIYSVNALYDSEIDKIILIANIFYPKPSGVSEPDRTGYMALFVGDNPLQLTYYGVLLTPFLVDPKSSLPAFNIKNNVFASSIVKVNGKYVILFNASSEGVEKIYRMDLGVDTPQTIRIVGTYTGTALYSVPIVRLPPGTKAIISHAVVFAYSGTPTELYIHDGNLVETGQDTVITWTNTSRLELNTPVVANGEFIGIAVRGVGPISIAYSISLIIKPAIDII